MCLGVFFMSGACIMIMPDLATIQFSFFSFIYLSSASVCALSMKKFTAALKLCFSSDLVPLLFVLFGKITLN
jgi:hypothetical protein